MVRKIEAKEVAATILPATVHLLQPLVLPRPHRPLHLLPQQHPRLRLVHQQRPLLLLQHQAQCLPLVVEAAAVLHLPQRQDFRSDPLPELRHLPPLLQVRRFNSELPATLLVETMVLHQE